MKNRNYSIIDILYVIIGCPWLFLMIMSSNLYTEIKAIFLGILFIVSLVELLIVKKGKFKKNYFLYVAIFVMYFMCSLAWGNILGYDFSLVKDSYLINTYCITPIATVIIVQALLLDKRRGEFLWNYIKYLTLLLAIFDVIVVLLHRMNISLPIFNFIKIYSNNLWGDTLALRVTNESSFMFLMPIYLFLLFCQEEKKLKDEIIYIGIVIFGFIYILLSGRKITELVLGVEIVVIVLWKIRNRKITSNKVTKFIGKSIIIIFIFFTLIGKVSEILNLDGLIKKAYTTLSQGLQSTDEGVSKRTGNAKALFDMWIASPIWGHGLNSYSKESIANATTHWSYEITYNALLAQTGIIGITIFGIGCYYIFNRLKKQYRKSNNIKYIAVLLGFLSFIICGATNPLVNFIWPWIISLLICEEEIENKENLREEKV